MVLYWYWRPGVLAGGGEVLNVDPKIKGGHHTLQVSHGEPLDFVWMLNLVTCHLTYTALTALTHRSAWYA